MKKFKTSSYILELEIKPNKKQIDIINKRFRIAKSIYNACLNQCLKRHKRLMADKSYRYWLNEKPSQERTSNLKEIRIKYNFTEYKLHEWVVPIKHHFKNQLGINEVQKLATRAFETVHKLHFDKFKKVYFKTPQEFITIEGKSNDRGLIFKKNKIQWGRGFIIPVIIKKNDKYAQLALLDRTKYVRILKREIRGRERFYVQLCQEGTPPQKHKTADIKNRVGIDIGTSTIAVVSDKDIFFREICLHKLPYDRLKKIDRAMSRIRLLNSNWKTSKNYLKTKSLRKEIIRKITVLRTQSHNILANYILSLGTDIRVEKMSFSGLQKRATKMTFNKKNGKIISKKRFGKSLLNYAPSSLLRIINNKLKYQGLELKEIDTYSVKASQFNHTTGEFKKKSLSERWNVINGVKIQRDLYSAFLIQNTTNDLKSIDIELCNIKFNNFLKLHEIEIDKIKKLNNKKMNWFVA